ncbi:tRNA dimethylallyltransferase [bioreactor metagenome]|uniref:tRNA dimethylallyltransferase n=1 Tax=bioreactor metagenome TaxID=1076179 RepID=A0A645EDJ2_9ZZZZ
MIVLLGPTGVGKTRISFSLAERFNSPIISSDSRQFYRELKIGTAAPTDEELTLFQHYCIGSHSIHDIYNAGTYEQDVLKLLNELFVKHRVVMLVGGSMMYIDAVCNGMDDIPSVNDEIRSQCQQLYTEKGLVYIQNELKRLDPEYYNQVDLQNYKRVLHALEICLQTGKPYSSQRMGQRKRRNFNVLKIGLNRPRPELYERINQRVDMMMQAGLLQEASQFYNYRHLNTLNTVGYKELFNYMEGKCTLEEAVQMIKQNSRRYAKRQMTWFNRDKDIFWFHPDDVAGVVRFIDEILHLK